MPDSRLTVYTQWGDWFAWCCVIYTAGAAASVLVRRAAGKGA
jgi:apolipoprotein N-acyltransferase